MAKRAGVGIPPCGMVRLRDGGARLHRGAIRPSGGWFQTPPRGFLPARRASTEPKIPPDGGPVRASPPAVRHRADRRRLRPVSIPDVLVLRGQRRPAPQEPVVAAPVRWHGHTGAAYDMVNTQLAIGDQKFAMLVGGADGPIRRSRWEQLAAYARIPPKAANLALSTQVRALEPMVALIRASFLPPEAQVNMSAWRARATGLIGPAGPDDEESPATPDT